MTKRMWLPSCLNDFVLPRGTPREWINQFAVNAYERAPESQFRTALASLLTRCHFYSKRTTQARRSPEANEAPMSRPDARAALRQLMHEVLEARRRHFVTCGAVMRCLFGDSQRLRIVPPSYMVDTKHQCKSSFEKGVGR
jgi:hypothetical protein